MKTRLLLVFLSAVAPQVLATNYYVSATGANTNDGKSTAKPFLTLQKAADLTVAGDTVFVMNGTYASTSGTILNVTRSGTATGYITYKAVKGHSPKITASGNVWNAVSINGSYIIFEGIELEGNNANLTYEGALAAYQAQVAGGPALATYNTNAISIGGPRTESKLPHHVTIRNCRVHDFPGGGISAIQADYTTIENNVVYNNAWYMVYGGSGISILTPFNSDKLTIYKNIVRNNSCFTNKTTIPWISQKKLSDGNGIIIDVNQHGYDNQSGTSSIPDEAYTGRTLVENNLSVNNGGSGIHAYKADHVDIINNTAYQNATVMTDYANIYANDCADVNIINNIMYAADGKKCNSNTKLVNVVYDYNIYFNGTVAVKGPNDLVADPQFVNPSTDPATANFTLRPTSPAIDQGSTTPGQFSLTDLVGRSRPQGAKPDRGAYEFSSTLVTGTTPAEQSDRAVVFPNPAGDLLTIRLPERPLVNTRIEVFSSTGSSLKKQVVSAGTAQVGIQDLPAGLYVVVVYQKDLPASVHKFIKQ